MVGNWRMRKDMLAVLMLNRPAHKIEPCRNKSRVSGV